jgi:hypothetical protein
MMTRLRMESCHLPQVRRWPSREEEMRLAKFSLDALGGGGGVVPGGSRSLKNAMSSGGRLQKKKKKKDGRLRRPPQKNKKCRISPAGASVGWGLVSWHIHGFRILVQFSAANHMSASPPRQKKCLRQAKEKWFPPSL